MSSFMIRPSVVTKNYLLVKRATTPAKAPQRVTWSSRGGEAPTDVRKRPSGASGVQKLLRLWGLGPQQLRKARRSPGDCTEVVQSLRGLIRSFSRDSCKESTRDLLKRLDPEGDLVVVNSLESVRYQIEIKDRASQVHRGGHVTKLERLGKLNVLARFQSTNAFDSKEDGGAAT
ncbi:hypothetical protein CROQUDRAFT_86525 [Cronartium quercuum f. sp. fusiforme G11]|uniref:Uncharacterized protein n=1 Tax=Cronartium quercuum f. sp. fusiforme G11 TaxID=708437 RepID=A0A9P6TH83_9BASI|nr:hypothetical protein CROQUDRAFT_86525 [Cronartium quercuum f. sp. fusiforme G11]